MSDQIIIYISLFNISNIYINSFFRLLDVKAIYIFY